MIYVHSLGRAVRYFPELTALAANGTRSAFRELHARVGRIAAAFTKHGFKAGDRLAILLPNEPVSWQLVLDQEPLNIQSYSIPDPIYDPNSILALIYTSGTTGRPKGVEIRHA